MRETVNGSAIEPTSRSASAGASRRLTTKPTSFTPSHVQSRATSRRMHAIQCPTSSFADANVIAVSATDADDRLFEHSNRGRHIAIAAPGAQILVAIPDGGYEVSSGTSYSAAEVSGIAALMLERRGGLTPDKVRDILLATAKDLGPKGRDIMFGAGLADAYGALMAEETPMAAMPRPVERANTGAR